MKGSLLPLGLVPPVLSDLNTLLFPTLTYTGPSELSLAVLDFLIPSHILYPLSCHDLMSVDE